MAQQGKRGMNAILSVFGGVFEKGSLANERNRVTFRSNLVRTSLACSIWRDPHLNPVRFTRKTRQRRARSMERPWGWNVARQNRLGRRCEDPGEGCRMDPCLSVQLSLLPEGSWLSFCPSSYWAGQQEPHNPTLAPAPENLEWKLEAACGCIPFHQPQPISNSSLSLLISFLRFPRKSAPLTHTHSHSPNPPPQACSKMSVCNSKGLVKGNQPVSSCATLTFPSSHPTIWYPGGLSLPGWRGQGQRAPTACKPLSRHAGQNANTVQETTVGLPQPFFSLWIRSATCPTSQ